jgi:colanic acid biosynthesis glycosyl transferase WcaI
MRDRGNLQLWSCYYEPEPTGIAPVSTELAKLMRDRGWNVEVVAAQPHYPEPRWPRHRRVSTEWRDGIRVVRVPLWVGRETARARIRQELSFAISLLAATPFLGRPLLHRPDLILAASPSFPALLPALVSSRARGVPLVLWLHDILPDGAATTGLLDERSLTLRASRWLERAAYRAAERIVVLSAPFRENLLAKGVPDEKIDLIYDPATRGVPASPPERGQAGSPRILSMGNIGLTQGLAPLVRSFEASAEMKRRDVRLTITGNGVAAEGVLAEIQSARTEMPGLLDDDGLARKLAQADLALVSQSFEGTEFNLPSKLMNFMAQALPVIAAVNPDSEVARLVRESGAGWVVDSSRPELFPETIASALDQPEELARRGTAAHAYAVDRFSPAAFASSFDEVLRRAAARQPGRGSSGTSARARRRG